MEGPDDGFGGDDFVVETTWTNLAFDEVKRAMKEPLKRRRAERQLLLQRAKSAESSKTDAQKDRDELNARSEEERKNLLKEATEQKVALGREEERRRRREKEKEAKKLRAEEKLRRLREQQQQQLQALQMQSDTLQDTTQREQASRSEWEAFYARNADKFYKVRK